MACGVFLIEDHDVPLVKTTLLFRGGLRSSRPDKVCEGSVPALCCLFSLFRGPGRAIRVSADISAEMLPRIPPTEDTICI